MCRKNASWASLPRPPATRCKIPSAGRHAPTDARRSPRPTHKPESVHARPADTRARTGDRHRRRPGPAKRRAPTSTLRAPIVPIRPTAHKTAPGACGSPAIHVHPQARLQARPGGRRAGRRKRMRAALKTPSQALAQSTAAPAAHRGPRARAHAPVLAPWTVGHRLRGPNSCRAPPVRPVRRPGPPAFGSARKYVLGILLTVATP